MTGPNLSEPEIARIAQKVNELQSRQRYEGFKKDSKVAYWVALGIVVLVIFAPSTVGPLLDPDSVPLFLLQSWGLCAAVLLALGATMTASSGDALSRGGLIGSYFTLAGAWLTVPSAGTLLFF